jgi:hypothetical protein
MKKGSCSSPLQFLFQREMKGGDRSDMRECITQIENDFGLGWAAAGLELDTNRVSPSLDPKEINFN